MAERKPISKKMRFEVFKRDRFTCQYCGRMAPDVVLEVDHIKPVAKGGKNEILNLVTSCMDCNRGKSDKELSDDSVIKKQQNQLQEIAERKEQLEMLLEWKEGLENLQEDYAEALNKLFISKTDFKLNNRGLRDGKKCIKEFGFQNVYDSAEIALDTYYTGSQESFETAFRKIGGICFNKKRQKDDPRFYYSNYLKKACKSNFGYYSADRVESFVFKNISNDEEFEIAKTCLMTARHWSGFCDNLDDEFGNRP